MTFATPPYLSLSDSSPSPVSCHGTGLLGRNRWRAAVLAAFVVLSALGATLTSAPTVAEAAGRTPIMQAEKVSAAGIAAWFRANQPSGYRATVSPETLAAYFVEEGRAEGVAGDLAFAQSVLETGWLRWPSHGQVHASYNNFSGIGACDGGTCTVARFRSARIGVRAQIHHLRAYADPTVTADNLANPLESPRFHLVSPKGKSPTWEQMGSGNWATDPLYASKILSIYRSMLTHAERHGGLAAPMTLAPAQRFADVWTGHAHREGIEELAERGVVRGCSTTLYCPDTAVTRGQLASILARSLDLPAADHPFRDAGVTHSDSIGALYAAGITQGCGRRSFCPDEAVSRGQLAAMLQRGLDLPESMPPFTDVAHNAHRDAIGAVAEAGITTGYADHTFRPDESVNRGQAATFVTRATTD